uniref:Uncharacterized protein n=1 Tax=Peronospora matthiolae TaxID=2874970 RepID=A0AAV1V1Z3_9STRA
MPRRIIYNSPASSRSVPTQSKHKSVKKRRVPWGRIDAETGIETVPCSSESRAKE